ncbi:hypothetical protein LINGRAHAP2_LOCUS37316 [Linum grandiflorum]
MGSLLIS